MPNDNKPRLDQYRVGSIIKYDDTVANTRSGFYQIIRIDKLKNAPMTYAVHYWKVGDPDPKDLMDTPWNGAHQINEMLDNGVMEIVSY